MSSKKRGAPSRYEKSFKQGAIKQVLEGGLSPKELESENKILKKQLEKKNEIIAILKSP